MKVNESGTGEFAKLKKNLSNIQARIWVQSVCKALQILPGSPNVTPEILASDFPTSAAIRREKFGEDSYLKQMSTQYWARVLAGERGIKDQGLIQRVDKQLGVSDQPLSSPLCAILKKPSMRSADYKAFIDILSPTLENRVFKRTPHNNQIKQSKRFWSYENSDLINSEEFLAYQILMINQQSAKTNGVLKRFSLQQLVLHFWRFLITSPFGRASETLCEALVFYLQENLSLKHNFCGKDCSSYFAQLRNIAYPEVNTFPAYTRSYEQYLAHNLDVCEAAEYQLTNGKGLILSLSSFYKEALYLADRYADQWIKGNYEKASLYSKGRPEYGEIVLTRNFRKTHRIW